ncbi:DMT family transporter [Campylobacter sp. MIT 21-1685]|uniref:DMT family transporter n=1 Tax=unclassified Campylobacter TaxID=2593542 RepID=UPI00224B8C53|nr:MULTISPECIES: DMT family transporter [unclassified Campylobacter]MCX2683263.1 DMT family transporter [Campylobacter sp. MIT 21-1684]MCX2751544.1 DMT family transporter [Campylobacter sp. MIT 21-1682]MCX2807743.1 DMT family transporter [Campylobacter sp. MIT 21-1685]
MLKIIRQNLGVYFMILASLDFAIIGACAKILSTELSSIEIMFFRNLIGVIFILYLLKKSKVHKEGGHFWILFFRGLAGTLSLYLFFYNVSNITLGGAFAFQKISPIFVSILAFFLFKENIGFKGFFGIILAFCGVLLIIQPWANALSHSGFDLKNSLLGLLSGLLAALAYVSVRGLRKFYDSEQIAFSFVFFGAVLPLFSMIIAQYFPSTTNLDFLFAPFVFPSLHAWFFIALMGIIGAVFQLHITKAYKMAKQAGIVAGISYLDVIFSLIIGILLGDNLPSAMVFLGIMGIILGGLLLTITQNNSSAKKNEGHR